MGVIVEKKNLNKTNHNNLLIYCCQLRDLASVELVSVNKSIADELLKLPSNEQRSLNMREIVSNILKNLPENVTIKNFDVMFNPEYNIDVLNLFTNIRKYRKFCIFWSGEIVDNKLVYSQNNYDDYKVFDINKYDVTCVI